MAINLYLTPATGVGSGPDPRRSSVWDSLTPYNRAQMDLGLQDTFLLAVLDISPADHAILQANATVTVIPDLDNTIGAGALTVVKNKLEALNLPANWVTAGMSYRVVVRYVAIFCQIFQRLHGRGAAKLLGSGVTLDTQFSTLPAGVRQSLLDVGADFGFNTSSLSGASTLRAIFKALADQWSGDLQLWGLTL